MKQTTHGVGEEVSQLEYEREQYQEQIDKVSREAAKLEAQIEASTVREHEIMIVQALIEEKASLAEEKSQLKKKCKEEKRRLDEELAKMAKKKQEMEAEEHAAVLAEIDAEFDAEHQKLMK